MKNGTVDLLNSERGTISIVLIILATVLVMMGKISADDWLTYTKWVVTVLVAAKTITSAVETMRKPADPAPVVPTATATFTATVTEPK